ncbi:hypothetical protein AB6A40_008439 [Gnathostoma spinigerum]|uniref:Protein twisted gastrulation n=1 Tax=Gnathostoma spinigerum TaxID=75299 RepID=A0ABD6EQC2_9BILA
MVSLLQCSLLLFFLLIYVRISNASTAGCSESACGPRISKCMLLKACNCTITRETILANKCTCCNECIQCLDRQFTQCCSCVGLCQVDKKIPRVNSYVDRFEPNDEDPLVFDRVSKFSKLGTTYSFPILSEQPSNIGEFRELHRIQKGKGTQCTVIYLDECISHHQCSRQCATIGAAMLRWFSTGCCECIGHTCLPYGSNVARCKFCTDYDEGHSQNSKKIEL